VLDVSFTVARSRLAALTHGGWLGSTSELAYADGLAGLIRVRPLGTVLGTSKLVRVRLLEPVPRDDTVVLPLRWEATGARGRLFPVLDANLVLTPGDHDHARLAVMGAYRPPLGAVGATLDRMLLNHAAAATVASLLTRVADSLLAPDLPPDLAPGAAAPTGPQNTGPQNTGPQNTGPQNTGPQDTGAHGTGPLSPGLQDTGPFRTVRPIRPEAPL
jgi:hypothetical protein